MYFYDFKPDGTGYSGRIGWLEWTETELTVNKLVAIERMRKIARMLVRTILQWPMHTIQALLSFFNFFILW